MKKELTSFHADAGTLLRLRRLSSITKVSMSEYVRQGVEMVLKKYERTLSDALPGGQP